MRKSPAEKLRAPPRRLAGTTDRWRGGVGDSTPQFTEGIHTYCQELGGKKTRARPQNLARAAQLRLLFPPGNAEARGAKEVRRSSGPTLWGWEVTALLPGAECPAGPQHDLHIPGEPENSRLESGAEVAGRDFGVPGSASLPTPVSAQLANSPTFAKLPRAGEQRRSGPHHRGPRGGSGLHWALAASGRSRKSSEKAAARGVWLLAVDPEEAGWDARLGRTRGWRCWRRPPPPRGGGAVAESGSPAGERRKCRGVGAGPAPRSLLFAEVLPPPGGRADARSWGRRGGAGGARRG